MSENYTAGMEVASTVWVGHSYPTVRHLASIGHLVPLHLLNFVI